MARKQALKPSDVATLPPAPRFFDEMRRPDGGIRTAYREFWKLVEAVPREQLLLKQAEADALFRRVGITCTAVTLYSGQLVAQSEFSVVTTLAPDSG